MYEDNDELGEVFERYRWACPEPELSAHFLPNLWARIEAKPTFSVVFGKLGRMFAMASLVLTLCLACLNLFAPNSQPLPSYTDALVSDSSAEQTAYTEAIRTGPGTDDLRPDSWRAQ